MQGRSEPREEGRRQRLCFPSDLEAGIAMRMLRGSRDRSMRTGWKPHTQPSNCWGQNDSSTSPREDTKTPLCEEGCEGATPNLSYHSLCDCLHVWVEVQKLRFFFLEYHWSHALFWTMRSKYTFLATLKLLSISLRPGPSLLNWAHAHTVD